MDEKHTEVLKARAFEHFPIAFFITNPNISDNPIVYVSRSFEQLTGYAAEAAIGKDLSVLHGPGTDENAVDQLSAAIDAGNGHRTDLLSYRADGSTFRNEFSIEPIHDDEGKLTAFLGLLRDLQKDGDDTSVAEQLRDIQHRVKNHLQMVVSMIRLQSESVGKRTASEDYHALAYRVETLQLLYQEMDRSTSEALVPMGAYVSRIATTVGHLEGRENVRLNIDTESFRVPMDTAARVGLLTSEIITNSYQHAFEGRQAGLIQVSLRQLSGGIMRLEVMDDGVGLPEEIDWPNTNTMGATIVKSLLTGVTGTMNVARGVAGTTVSVDVPLTDTSAKNAN